MRHHIARNIDFILINRESDVETVNPTTQHYFYRQTILWRQSSNIECNKSIHPSAYILFDVYVSRSIPHFHDKSVHVYSRIKFENPICHNDCKAPVEFFPSGHRNHKSNDMINKH